MNIQTPAEHTAAMERLSALMDAAPTLGSPESDELTGLAESIEAYEARTFPIAMDKGSAKADTTQRAQLEALGDKIKDAGLDSADYTG